MSDNNPLVSVVMPVYNGEQFLQEAIESILHQTFEEFEFIIVNDGSTDRSLEIIQGYAEKDQRILLSSFERNMGFISALDFGLRKANGVWIARMDCDDISHPQRIETQLRFLQEHPECVFVGTTYLLISPAGKLLMKENNLYSKWEYVDKEMITLSKQKFADPSVIFSRKAAVDSDGYDQELCYEIPLWYRLLLKGRGACINTPLHYYRVQMNSLSKRNSNDEEKRNLSRNTRLKYDPENAHLHSSWKIETYTSFKILRRNSYRRAIDLCNVTRDISPAFRCFSQAIKEYPFDLKLYLLVVYGLIIYINPRFRSRKIGYIQVLPTDLIIS